MKKIMIALTIMLTMAATGKAMSYEQARNEALFLNSMRPPTKSTSTT